MQSERDSLWRAEIEHDMKLMGVTRVDQLTRDQLTRDKLRWR